MIEFYQAFLNMFNEYFWQILLLIVIYVAYYYIYSQKVYKIKSTSQTNTKNIGNPPPYPNGWFIISKSKDLKHSQSKSVDINGHNLVLFRSVQGVAYALEAYCKHLGANLGIGGKCPFHGWFYNGETGLCVDYNGKPITAKSYEYNEDFGRQNCKLEWKVGKQENVKLRKYPICEMNNYIYVWIHAMVEYQNNPLYPVLNVESLINKLEYRGKTIHEVMCHSQDITQNGADIYHFKYVHKFVVQSISSVRFNWKAKWKRGDDPDIKQLFEHDNKAMRQFKQMIYKEFVQNYPQKKWLSIAYLDNYLQLPFLGEVFMFSATVIQIGSGIVNIFVKFPTHCIVFFHYLQPQEKYKQIVFHEAYVSKWVPYWLSAISLKFEGDQVTNDMQIWNKKQFARKINIKQNDLADQYLRQWRKWYSQNYEGTLEKERQKKIDKLSW